jgi:alkanesulfonate monooxygenase SsuD/methylene tetrahydromethanopterin reductase-like flavin-dependent oxidoreductase (luciferase family)
MSLRFGLIWPFRNPDFARVPWDELYRDHFELIVESEALGYDHAWLTEHHFVDDGYSPSLLTIGGAVAARTTRIRIGTFVLLLPLHNPVEVAEDTATLDLISGGRFDLGVGLGYRKGEFESQGVSRAGRGTRMEESLEVIRRLLSDETVTFDGEKVKVRDLRIVPPALQRPHTPMWVGGIAPKAVDRAARMGFNFLCGGHTDPAIEYAEALRRHGRDPQDYRVAGMRVIYVAPTREQAWEIAARAVHHTAACYLQWYVEENDDPAGAYAEMMRSMSSVDEILEQQSFNFFGEESLVGTPEDVIPKIEEYVTRGGITDLVCALPLGGISTEDIRAGMELFAREVIPHLQEAGGAAPAEAVAAAE